ncbi:MAG: chemotaxis response regulator protein-glutamate methylesterase [Gammaproteobacteria bacterium]|nr:chemotaxis response regulator protein-glutamate methylesterase [Gammaproteobacteria bacterium]
MVIGGGIQKKVRVLVVDDSGFFRRHISKLLSKDEQIEVVGTAGDGLAGFEAAKNLKPDVITMDVEMPVMDGITAVKKIMSEVPTPILMLSSYTSKGAKETLDALSAGAMDFIPKQSSKTPDNSAQLSEMLVQKVLAVGNKQRRLIRTPPAINKTATEVVSSRSRESPQVVHRGSYDLVVVGASTGGPVAIQNLMCSLPKNFSTPLVLAIHMPGNFTKAFAERLNNTCSMEVKEAVDGDRLQPGVALLAPGGKQLYFSRSGVTAQVRIRDGKPEETYKPCIDTTLESAAQVMGGSVLAVILTGMGSDGCQGASMLKQCNSTVWSQDEASCVIYGMPQAVEKRGLSDMVLPLNEIGPALVKAV